jgi:DNA-binding NarL/FixJ family response regulator
VSDVRVLIVDDHPVVRQGIRSLLSNRSEIEVVGDAGTLDTAVAAYRRLRPDVTLLDIRLADGSGLDALRSIRDEDEHARVLMLSSFDDDEYVVQSLQAGASGYVLKSDSDSLLVNAVLSVASGGLALSSHVTGHLVARLSNKRVDANLALDDQSRRLLAMVATGQSNAQMARSLFVSEATVKRRLRAVFDELGVANRVEAVAEAARRGVLSGNG